MPAAGTSPEVAAFISAAAIADPVAALAKLEELRAGVKDINATNELGESALHLAKKAKVARWLISEGANVNLQDAQGCTPLHRATARGFSGIVHALLDCGASTEIKNKSGFTPLALAWQNAWEQPKLILIAFGADKTGAPSSLRRISPLVAAVKANLPRQLAKLLGDGVPNWGPSSPQRLFEYAQGEFGRDSICAILQAHIAKQAMQSITSIRRASP